GVVSRIAVPEGAQGVKVNAVIAELAGEGEAPAKGNGGTAKAEPVAAKVATATASPAKAEAQSGGQSPPGKESGSPPSRGMRIETAPAEPRSMPAPASSGQRVRASPLARRLARMENVDLLALKGSGPHGRIIKADV